MKWTQWIPWGIVGLGLIGLAIWTGNDHLITIMVLLTFIAVNAIIWLTEWTTGKKIRFFMDIGGTIGLAVLGSSGMIMMTASLGASLVWSWYINKVWKFKDVDEWPKGKRLAWSIIGVAVLFILVKAYTPII